MVAQIFENVRSAWKSFLKTLRFFKLVEHECYIGIFSTHLNRKQHTSSHTLCLQEAFHFAR